MKTLSLLLALVILGVAPLPAFAQDDKAGDAEPKNEVLEAAREFMKDLDEPSQRHFSVFHGNYNLIKVVETVRESVDEAVDGCGDANPDMKDALETRFDEWKDAVKPVLEDADANVKNMILAQDYAKPKDLRKFMKMIDKARKKQSKDVKKVAVVTPEACQNLLEKMDDTQPNMIKLLQATLVSLPQSMQAQDDEARAKAEAKAAEKAEKERIKAEKEQAKAEAKAAAEAKAKAKEEAKAKEKAEKEEAEAKAKEEAEEKDDE